MPTLLPQLSRSDRTVRRARLRLPAEGSRHRIGFLLEEALRLAALPGEDEGRVYFFRQLRLQIPSPTASRKLWLEQGQAALRTVASGAVHGTDGRANSAAAIYFDNDQQALEWLLGRLLHSSSQTLPAEWFAPMIAGTTGDPGPAPLCIAIIERLRRLPSGWFSAASTLLATLERAPAGTLALLALIPGPTLRGWLSELGGNATKSLPPPPLTSRSSHLLLRCAAQLGVGGVDPVPGHPHAHSNLEPPALLIWLAALTVVAQSPGELDRRTPVTHARKLLEAILQPPRSPMHKPAATRAREATALNPPAASSATETSRAATQLNFAPDRPRAESPLDASEPTQAAGLYFLLNTLRYLGFVQALETLSSPVAHELPAHLIQSLGHAAGVSSADPALLWADIHLMEKDQQHDSPLIRANMCWPGNLPLPADNLQISLSSLVRVWHLAIRRWCWRTAHLTLPEIVQRPGRVLLTRTDLDVTLPLDSVDLRVRRAGLDLDPGWLPWFGRVVRFHYESPKHGTGVRP